MIESRLGRSVTLASLCVAKRRHCNVRLGLKELKQSGEKRGAHPAAIGKRRQSLLRRCRGLRNSVEQTGATASYAHEHMHASDEGERFRPER